MKNEYDNIQYLSNHGSEDRAENFARLHRRDHLAALDDRQFNLWCSPLRASVG